MVRGIKLFQEHFREHSHQYILIGGAACDLIMEEAALPFRGTKDLDIVLCIEALDASFGKDFWDFIHSGRYTVQQKSTGEKQYYRFLKPENEDYPFMLELFSRKPEVLSLVDGSHLTPVPVGEDVSSMSAILLNDDYYYFLHSGKKMIAGVSVAGPEHLIPLKARAWIDLAQRKRDGEAIDGKLIVKHKNDIFRLYRVLDPDLRINIPTAIRSDVVIFLDAMKTATVDLKNLGIKSQSIHPIIEDLSRFYGIGS